MRGMGELLSFRLGLFPAGERVGGEGDIWVYDRVRFIKKYIPSPGKSQKPAISWPPGFPKTG